MIQTLFAPAKINLCLHVLGKRPDGYHELAMLMQRLTLGDRVTIELTDTPGVSVVCPGVELAPGGENIASRAAKRMLELTGAQQGVRIVIDKQIPVAAGLGGGSSNAAAVLLGLNTLLAAGLDRPTLLREGVKLGADVPFFLFEQTAWASGIGEILTPAPPLPTVWYVLVNPGFAVSTATVFQNLGLTAGGVMAKLPRFPGTLEEMVVFLHNDLERVTIPRHPEIADIKSELTRLGAAGALMSGSGPTVFGLFVEEAVARQAATTLRQTTQWRVETASPY